MTREYLYNVWAPPGAPWSDWCKPVVFAHLNSGTTALAPPQVPPPVDWTPPADGSTAIVLDIPGSMCIWIALELAHKGFRPVPLYNAIPGQNSMCDLDSIAGALVAGTITIDALNLPYDAPPAFLLDAARRTGLGLSPTPGRFDNRSVSLPTDFPSANLMFSRGIRKIVLAQFNAAAPQEDLAHTLLRYEKAGIEIESIDLSLHGSRPQRIDVPRPPMFRQFWQRLMAVAGLHRHPAGGFGAVLPMPSSGG